MPGAREWLNLLDDEVAPQVLESVRPSRVVWSSLWLSRQKDQVRLELAAAGGDTSVRFTLLTPDELPDQSKTGHIRKRITTCSSPI